MLEQQQWWLIFMESVLIDILQTQPDSFRTREQKTAGVLSPVASSWPRLAGLILTECGCVRVRAPTSHPNLLFQKPQCGFDLCVCEMLA